MEKIRKLFDILVNDNPRAVYGIYDKEHEGYNGTPKHWWIYEGSQLPEGAYPDINSRFLRPYCCKSMERHLWDIRFKQRTTTKEKWGETDYRTSTYCEILCNGKPFYAFPTTGGINGLSFAMAKAQHMIVVLWEHPFDFFEPQKENGRKIYWHGLPATVQTNSHHTWEIGIIPDYTCGLDKEQWWEELKRRKSFIPSKDDGFENVDQEIFNENKHSDYINWGDAFEDRYINWFRK